MEVKIGIVNVARELVVETSVSADSVVKSLNEAQAAGGVWQLSDDKGRKVLVPVERIGYVDLGAETARPVGFGAV